MPEQKASRLPFHYAWVIVATGTLSIFACLGFGRFALGMLLPSMAATLKLSYSEIGFISTGNFIGYLAAVLFCGHIAKKVGSRRLIVIALVVISASMALISRARTGQGQVVDIALLDAAVSILGLPTGIVAATGRSPGRLGNAHPSLAPYEPYPAADGQVIVAVANPRLWSRFCTAVGLEDLEHDPRFATNSDRLAHRFAVVIDDGRSFEDQVVGLGHSGVPPPL
jgi:hypothetical protein